MALLQKYINYVLKTDTLFCIKRLLVFHYFRKDITLDLKEDYKNPYLLFGTNYKFSRHLQKNTNFTNCPTLSHQTTITKYCTQ